MEIVCVDSQDLARFKREHVLKGAQCVVCRVTVVDWILYELARKRCRK